jgi:O-antigen ligase
MYSHYPILGLGKGSFNRENSILEFSKSPFFESYPGENAHNYFLQILAETGIVGLSLFCAIFIYQALFLRNQHNQIVTVLILGIFLGNIYGHSLLIPNLLVLLFILLGASNTEIPNNESKSAHFLRSILPKNWRYFIIAVAIFIVIVSIIEVKTSYGKIPFQQRFICYKPQYYSDQHISGLFEETYKVSGNSLKVEYTVYHPDTPIHPLTLVFNLEQKGQKIASYERTINSPGRYEENFDISRLVTASNISLRIKTSRCLTPVNLGLNLDKRRLGIQLNEVSQDTRVVKGSSLHRQQ